MEGLEDDLSRLTELLNNLSENEEPEYDKNGANYPEGPSTSFQDLVF